MEAFLLSNSTNFGQDYLSHVKNEVVDFLSTCQNILFVPFAGVTISYDDYTEKVRSALPELANRIHGIHTFENPKEALATADAVAVGGGNTFHLLHELYRLDLIDAIREQVQSSSLKYIGWSAGSNVAGLTICTTNDMPIIEPPSFQSLKLVPFQINPHYTEATLPNHGGESRADRLLEYVQLAQSNPVVCLPEGTWLRVQGEMYSLGRCEQVKVYAHPNEVNTWSATQLKTYAERL